MASPPAIKNPHAQALGRLGGSARAGNPKGFSTMDPARLAELGRKYGRKPSCECGGCKKCKNRIAVQNFRRKAR